MYESDNVYACGGDGHTFWGQSPYSNAPVIPVAAATTTGDKHVMPEHNSFWATQLLKFFLGHPTSKSPPLSVMIRGSPVISFSVIMFVYKMFATTGLVDSS